MILGAMPGPAFPPNPVLLPFATKIRALQRAIDRIAGTIPKEIVHALLVFLAMMLKVNLWKPMKSGKAIVLTASTLVPGMW